MIEAEEQKIENEKKRMELVHAYKRLFQTDDGKKVYADMELFCGFLKTSTNVEWNPYQTMFAEGKRRVFLRMISMMNHKEAEND